MNFQNLSEGDCGQVNPLAQFASHMTQDVGHQDRIGASATPLGNARPPQSFQMHNLVNEMETIESQANGLISAVESASSLSPQWAAEYQEHVARQETGAGSNFLLLNRFENAWPRNQPPGYIRLPRPQVPFPFFPQRQVEVPFGATGYVDPSQELSNEYGLVVESLDELEDIDRITKQDIQPLQPNVKQNTQLLETKVEENTLPLETEIKQNTETKSDSQELWMGIPIYDKEKLSNLIAKTNSLVTFCNYLHGYQRKCEKEEWERNNPNKTYLEFSRRNLLEQKEYSHIEDNPQKNCDNPIRLAELERDKGNFSKAILYADEATRRNPEDIHGWKMLLSFYVKEIMDIESFFVAKQVLRLDPYDTDSHLRKITVYMNYGFHYETLESIFACLKNDKSYCDIIPPNFKIAKKSSNNLKQDVESMLKMFIKAAQRNPTKPDTYIQEILAVLCNLSYEYEKSKDCKKLITQLARNINSKAISHYNLGNRFLFLDKPHEALDAYMIAVIAKRQNLKNLVYDKIGTIHMYLADYREAIRWFKMILDPDDLNEEVMAANQGELLNAERELCLRLHYKVYMKLKPYIT